jgi:hypothetical protein
MPLICSALCDSRDERLLYERVHTAAKIHTDAFVFETLRGLKVERDPVPFQVVRHAWLMGGFQHSRTDLAMSFDRTADHPVRQLVEFHPSSPSVLFVVKWLLSFGKYAPFTFHSTISLGRPGHLILLMSHFPCGSSVAHESGSVASPVGARLPKGHAPRSSRTNEDG